MHGIFAGNVEHQTFIKALPSTRRPHIARDGPMSHSNVPKRRAKPKRAEVVDVPVNVNLDPLGWARVVQEVIHHVLFIRNQIPELYATLRQRHCELDPGFRDAPEPGERLRKLPRSEKKVAKLVGQVEALGRALQTPGLFVPNQGIVVHVAFGPSPTRAREAYQIRAVVAPPSPVPQDGPAGRAEARSVLRALMACMAGAADDAWSQAPARLHVLVARQCGAQALPTTAGFVLREGLQLRMTRGRVYRIRATSEAEECTPTAERDPAPVADSAMEDSGAEVFAGGAPVDQGQAGLEPALETGAWAWLAYPAIKGLGAPVS